MQQKLLTIVTGLFISIIVFSSLAGTPSEAGTPGVALIYAGEGVCDELCVESAHDVAVAAGLKPKMVNGTELNQSSSAADVAKFFNRAEVWVQPGGYGNTALWSMTDRMRNELRAFIQQGGGFVGFCAGAFFATEYIGRRGEPGFGIFPGSSLAYPYYPIRRDLAYTLETVTWNGVKRSIYLEGGPYLIIPQNSAVEVIATYSSGAVATARTTYGAGRVYITGLHPEAPAVWTGEDGIQDPDGSDQFLAVEMIKWASHPAR